MPEAEIQSKDHGALIKLSGRLDTECVGRNWSSIFLELQQLKPSELTLVASGLDNLDGAGIAFLLSLQRHQQETKAHFQILNLKPPFQKLLKDNTLEEFAKPSAPVPSFRRFAEDVGYTG